MDPEDSGHWFQWRVQELVRSLQQAGRGRDRERDREAQPQPQPQRERARTAPLHAASLAGRLRQFAQQQPPRLRRLFSAASSASSSPASASAPASAPGSPLRRQERVGAGDAPPPDTAPPVLERPATAAPVVGGEPSSGGAGPDPSLLKGTLPPEAQPALAPAPPPCRDERAGPQEPQPAVPLIRAEQCDGDGAPMDVTEGEPEPGESASASMDGEVPSIVLEPPTALTASQDGEAEGEGEGTDSPSRAPARGPSDEEADPEADVDAEDGRARRQPRLSLSLQPEAEAAAAAHRKSPVTVQEWVDSLPGPQPATRNEEDSEELPIEDGEEALDLGLGAEAGLLYNGCPPVTIVSPSQPCLSPTAFGAVSEVRLGRQKEISPGLVRESSVQSDVTSHGSHGSSVDSFLESRKPDPEEVLLNLGFGGPPIAENEVSRIPRRFLQPSKVKGVAIDDFLRYQQDLIENFETGFCGYRGLTGSSHTPPSVIVAKIREKLRSAHSVCASLSQSEEGASLLVPGCASAPASTYDAPRRRFSRAARRVLRDLPPAQPQADSYLSVLTPDNRRFLDNQGRNKSPDVPRKRIVFGERSFTFAGDGDLVEVQQQPPSPPPQSTPLPPPPQLTDMAGRPRPRPLLHKDSVLSSATSLSMTSLDSDSDTDEGSYERRLHNPQPYRPPFVPVTQSSQNAEPSSQTLHNIGNTTSDSESSVVQTVPQRPRFNKRVSSTSISSWESEGPHARFYLSSPTFDSPNSSRPVRYESIDEDVEMTFSDTMESSAEGMGEQNEKNQTPHNISEGNKELRTETEDDVFGNSKNDTHMEMSNVSQVNVERESVNISEVHPPCVSGSVSDVHSVKSDKERLLIRRSSLKRQNRVIDEDVTEYENSNSVRKTDVMLTDETLPVLKFTSHEADHAEENCCGRSGNSMERDGSQETLVASPKLECANLDTSDTVQPVQSQFLDPGIGVGKCTTTCADEEVETHQNEPSSTSFLSASPAPADESFEMEELMTCDDETNGAPLTLARTRSDSSGFLEGERSPPPQAPPPEAGLTTSDAPTHPPPIGGCVNKFSSCSEESVVHVPSRDLRELLNELAGRGVQLPDSASFACQQTGSEQQVEAVRMALEMYSEQLECGSRTKMLDVDGTAEQLRKQIAAELRNVATLLEEQPASEAAAAITRQVTALLREQTRLCHQLESLTGCNVEDTNSATDPITSPLHCCCESERMLEAVREENRRLERLVEAHSAELAEIRQMLSRLVDKERDSAAL